MTNKAPFLPYNQRDKGEKGETIMICMFQ